MKLLCLFFLLIGFSFDKKFTPDDAIQSDPIDKIAGLIRTGNVHELSKSFSSSVELTILDDDNTYSRSQAELKVTNFFKQNPVKTVSILHRVNSSADYRFGVLIATTPANTYRISVSLKKSGAEFMINELRIEPEKAK
jgi:hypothetical protein